MGSSGIEDGDARIYISNRFVLWEADDELQMEGAVESHVHSLVVEPHNPSVEHSTDSTLGNVNVATGGADLNLNDTCKFLKTIDSCLDICNIIVEKPVAPLVRSQSPSNRPDDSLADKGGTKDPLKGAPNLEKQFDASKPESIMLADEELSQVMARLENPELNKPKARKPILRVPLVKGHSGAILKSSSITKR